MSDIISCLPDDVLCHILSFLPTKYSICTRILSTRWKYLFAYVAVLDFDYLRDSNAPANDRNVRKSFADFVNLVFAMHNSPQITKLRLVNIFRVLPTYFDSWISSAICRNVQELDIYVEFYSTKTLPHEIFSSQTLSVLKVKGNFKIEIPICAFLPCLKTLHLRAVSFGHSNRMFLSFCPVLEDLYFESCYFKNVKVLDINAPSLRELGIHGCQINELVLNTPSLVCFGYMTKPNKIRGEIVPTTLVKAVIDTHEYSPHGVMCNVVAIVSHARHLYLSRSAIEAFGFYTKTLPTFHRLTRLEIGKVSYTVFALLPDILNRCSLLEVLVFDKGFIHEFSDDDSDSDSDEELSYMYMGRFEKIPWCVLVHLKEIEFREFTMRKTEWKLVEYFLKNAQVLNKMEIQTNLGREKQTEFTKKLLTFSKLSKDFQAVVDWDDEIED